MFELGGRRRYAFYALFGSHNYNLNTENSDKDYKVFVLPSFKDLYSNKQFSTSSVTSTFDYDVHDVRKLGELFWKSNINFMEVLFSKEISLNKFFKYELKFLFDNREGIARMNLPYLYNACVGMHHQKRQRMYGKGTESTKNLVEKYGYECKEASHAYRVLDFLDRYYKNNFTSFRDAIYYEDTDVERDVILGIKSGLFTLNSVESALNTKLEYIQSLEISYKKHTPDEKLKEQINYVIMDMIKSNLKEELSCQ